jgi:hypothetical protein
MGLRYPPGVLQPVTGDPTVCNLPLLL